ncbi:hypothetical protein GUITHDRAFT_109374 [Guillardia theta CCMP2712]|uniref:JmjC domain-containing protein n=1 Tax=Guillardia theta (strain CCMP2712) TaxID=905079 RepID=L1J7T3_GUITC|nr:hypothetical protein GUITHDRAFT_109374 [Guillardia theta CCMP2712]EKX44598.1 hypothetical protein GUITHDRAFT_109374 [Guillardia theta CCMP2712]|eukprot:XP_005831578.1 hypothetical protein GUITHDRAFT_109374 [Guillardia theta CCMP2712]
MSRSSILLTALDTLVPPPADPPALSDWQTHSTMSRHARPATGQESCLVGPGCESSDPSCSARGGHAGIALKLRHICGLSIALQALGVCEGFAVGASPVACKIHPPREIDGRPLFTDTSSGFNPVKASDFIKTYWQKHPVLLRNAFRFESPVSPDELAGLACEKEIFSRIVIEWGALKGKGAPPDKPSWEMLMGPFEEETFASLPESHYTLLVQEVSKHVPEVAELGSKFQFIPSWRMDDVMISYAAEGGGVGPHVDNYDVFLLQGKGKRRWSISAKTLAPKDEVLKAGLNLRILEGTFVKDEEWILEPGGHGLRLDPSIDPVPNHQATSSTCLQGHWGVSMDDECMTYSIGFRAPNIQDLVTEYSAHVSDLLDPDEFYQDPHLKPPGADAARIDEESVSDLWRQVVGAFFGEDADKFPRSSSGEEKFKRWLGGYLTQPMRMHDGGEPEQIDREEAVAIVDDLLSGNEACLFQTEGMKFVWLALSDGVSISANGKSWELQVDGQLSQKDLGNVIEDLIEEGLLYCPEM